MSPYLSLERTQVMRPVSPCLKALYIMNYSLPWASLVAQLVKNPPAMQETPVWFPGWEDLLEKG